MITRLKIDGFKNLSQVEVHFGPFTCIAGGNAVGKSNLFDAIQFLSYLADRPLLEAARSIRSEEAMDGEVQSLFERGPEEAERRMSFEVDLIIPAEGEDHLGQSAEASITALRYRLVLGLNAHPLSGPESLLTIVHEELAPIPVSEARSNLGFAASTEWKKAVIKGRRPRTNLFISTEKQEDGRIHVRLHQDGQRSNLKRLPADRLPRTALSSVDAGQYPTALLARQEMRSWHLLQLEPSALRQSDRYDDLLQWQQAKLDQHGRHLPATLLRLDRTATDPDAPQAVFQQLTNRLSELVGGVKGISVEKDDRQQLLTLYLTDRLGGKHAARALSDGTLRFLGLSVIEQDPDFLGVICLEEPENGIHPAKVPAMLRLLRDIALDPREDLDPSNPLRQVIINTHSPQVVQQVPYASMLLLDVQPVRLPDGRKGQAPVFHAIEGTWRMEESKQACYRFLRPAQLRAYLAQSTEDYLSMAEPQATYPNQESEPNIAEWAGLQLKLNF